MHLRAAVVILGENAPASDTSAGSTILKSKQIGAEALRQGMMPWARAATDIGMGLADIATKIALTKRFNGAKSSTALALTKAEKPLLLTNGAYNTYLNKAIIDSSDLIKYNAYKPMPYTNLLKANGLGNNFVDTPFDYAGKLKPNVKYKSGEFGYNYETDLIGRVENFSTDKLQTTTRTQRISHNPNTFGKLPNDHAGHIAGDRFGGSGELDNLISQSSQINLSTYRKIENQWAKAIREGKTVKVDVKIKYDGNNVRPSGFHINYEIDGKPFTEYLDN